ncbi:DUF3021 domain-containing protein [Levilactobacillus enshiensis]|uniref:DUF3021 domain-containing protein n=1 Tax=Levilactobacillus enshiensis TaxID=2590213 RepID=UPI00117B1380|nr:DUF3021 domain-containing protein [Levilactobacillus enshiensis]
MNKVILYGMRGMGYGAVAYLLMIATRLVPANVSPKAASSVLLMSAAVGILSIILDEDYERLARPLVFGIQLVGTAILMMALMAYNGWTIDLIFWGEFVLVYVVVWLAVAFDQHLRVTKINQALKKRNKGKS